MANKLLLVVACGLNGEIGKDNKLLWDIPLDMKHFRDTTRGRVVIMGRKTFESIGMPLPNRFNIVVSSNPEYKPFGVHVSPDIEDAIMTARSLSDGEDFCVIGGAKIYEQVLPVADEVILTLINAAYPHADARINLEELYSVYRLKSTFFAAGPDKLNTESNVLTILNFNHYVRKEPFPEPSDAVSGIRQTLVG